MNIYNKIGDSPWTRKDFLDHLKEFSEVYEHRPIKNNDGGMKAAQLFYAWYIAKKLQPKVIIESGVWYGQGTWAFEQAAPNAVLHCIDPTPRYRSPEGYESKKATYYTSDFLNLDWSRVDKEGTLCFFDDHQNALQRLVRCCELGFKTVMFEDNYPLGQGDCYSIKKALNKSETRDVIPGLKISDYLKHIVGIYLEFPPIFSAEENRWGLPWDTYETPEPLLKEVKEKYQKIYLEELKNYTWINYVELK